MGTNKGNWKQRREPVRQLALCYQGAKPD